MVNIFLAYSGKDKDFVDEVVRNLYLSPDHYNLLYYHKSDLVTLSIDEIIEKIPLMDMFILLLSVNSISSSNVNKELKKALSSEKIKEICRIVIDETDITQSNELFDCLNNDIYIAKTSETVAEIIKARLSEYEMIII